MVRFERKAGVRVEALDCMVYGLAAKAALALNASAFDQREDALRLAPVPAKPPALPGIIRSEWVNR